MYIYICIYLEDWLKAFSLDIWMQRCQVFSLIIKKYISRWLHTSNKALTFSSRRSLVYRNQPIDLLCKLMDWFLYDKDIRHERVKMLFTHDTPKVCSHMLWSRISFFFSIRFFFTNIMIHRAAGEGKSYLFNFSLPLPPTSQTL